MRRIGITLALVFTLAVIFVFASPVDQSTLDENLEENSSDNLADSYDAPDETDDTYYSIADLGPQEESNSTVPISQFRRVGGGSSSAVSQNTQVLNNVPVADDDDYIVDENFDLNIIAPGVLDNDNDLDNDPLDAILEIGTTNGALMLNENGSFSYTPNSNFNGVDSFTYKANDGHDDSNIATVTIKVNPTVIPEFPTIALPVISIIGLMFLLQRRKGE